MRPVHQFANRCVAPNVAIGVRNVVRSVRNVTRCGCPAALPDLRGPLRRPYAGSASSS